MCRSAQTCRPTRKTGLLDSGWTSRTATPAILPRPSVARQQLYVKTPQRTARDRKTRTVQTKNRQTGILTPGVVGVAGKRRLRSGCLTFRTAPEPELGRRPFWVMAPMGSSRSPEWKVCMCATVDVTAPLSQGITPKKSPRQVSWCTTTKIRSALRSLTVPSDQSLSGTFMQI